MYMFSVIVREVSLEKTVVGDCDVSTNWTVVIIFTLTTTLHLTLKMTTAQVVETSVTNNSLSKDYPHPDGHAKQITDTRGLKPFTIVMNI